MTPIMAEKIRFILRNLNRPGRYAQCREGMAARTPLIQSVCYGMIRKSGKRFSEKIMPKQEAKAP
jgi:hypothetical protein